MTPKSRIRLALLGANGKMGTAIQSLLKTPDFSSFELTQTFGTSRPIYPSDPNLLKNCDLLLDFSLPTALVPLFSYQGPLPPIVVGSTGWSHDEDRKLVQFAQRTPVFKAANFSLGVALVQDVLSKVSDRWTALGFKARMTETHHIHKKDSPSGTAKALRLAMGPAHQELLIESVRKGEVIGDHAVIFESQNERIEIHHSALDRKLFAEGALRVGQWLVQKNPAPGMIYSMQDFLQNP